VNLGNGAASVLNLLGLRIEQLLSLALGPLKVYSPAEHFGVGRGKR